MFNFICVYSARWLRFHFILLDLGKLLIGIFYDIPDFPHLNYSAPTYDFMHIGVILLWRFRRDIGFLC